MLYKRNDKVLFMVVDWVLSINCYIFNDYSFTLLPPKAVLQELSRIPNMVYITYNCIRVIYHIPICPNDSIGSGHTFLQRIIGTVKSGCQIRFPFSGMVCQQ